MVSHGEDGDPNRHIMSTFLIATLVVLLFCIVYPTYVRQEEGRGEKETFQKNVQEAF